MSDTTIDPLDWLDKKFVESILRHEESDDELEVLDIDVQSVVPKGDNYVSLLVRVTIEFISNLHHENNAKVKKRSLIVKSLPVGELMQMFIEKAGIFVREASMYEVTLPRMYKLIQERTGVDDEHFATNFYTCERPDTIVLEDLRTSGYKMADRRQGLDLQHTTKAIRILAKFHATSMVLHAEDPNTVESYPESIYLEENREMHGEYMESTLTSIASLTETWPGFERYAEKIRAIAPVAVDRAIEMFRNKEGSLKVLSHGDFWTNNMLFRYEDGKVADVKILDFQMVRYSSPATDILYFLNTSPNVEVYESSWDQIIEEYHDSFAETLRNLGDDRVVSLEDINKELEDKAVYSVIISCMFCIMVAEPEDAPDMSKITEENMNTEGVNILNKACNGERFRNAFQRRLPKFEAKGLI